MGPMMSLLLEQALSSTAHSKMHTFAPNIGESGVNTFLSVCTIDIIWIVILASLKPPGEQSPPFNMTTE